MYIIRSYIYPQNGFLACLIELSTKNRSLPHQYYVRAMEASLHSISKTEPGATVDVAVFSEESQWGGMVDEMGVPLDWDVPGDICEDLGLHCTQVRNQFQ